jgi:hypothetical protein
MTFVLPLLGGLFCFAAAPVTLLKGVTRPLKDRIGVALSYCFLGCVLVFVAGAIVGRHRF